jgi:hypothetical protein
MKIILPGQHLIEQYHTFVVRLPIVGGLNLNFVPLLKNFVTDWKPAHTSVIFYAVIPISDEIDVREEINISATLHLADAPYVAPVIKKEVGTLFSGLTPKTWPLDETTRRGVDWDIDDTLDKYEATYLVGVGDDYSGDGSFNEAKRVLDMVNSGQSDVNVIETRMWVPIVKILDSLEFELGEEVELVDSGGDPFVDYGWDTELYPVILHIGSGVHPRLPFGIYNPQTQHPYTYVLLGFYQADGTNNYGDSDRLRALQNLDGSVVKLKGRTSTALATVNQVRNDLGYPNYDKAVDHSDADHSTHKFYFDVHFLFEGDALSTFGPKEQIRFQSTQYIGFNGVTIGDYGIGGILPPNPIVEVHGGNDLQLQMHPKGAEIDSAQFIPSVGPGLFTNWADQVPGDDLTWGWDDEGLLLDNPTAVFNVNPTATALQNVHLGKAELADKNLHWSHGFTSFAIPAPDIWITRFGTSPGIVRIEGSFFIDDDITRISIPTADSFDGTIGGSWVFFRHQVLLQEFTVSAITFESGLAALPGDRTVLGIDGNEQTSTGHVLLAVIPGGLPNGTYDVILRHYRPWALNSGDPEILHIDKDEVIGPYIVLGGIGAGTEGYGSGPFGE